jgi:chaperonin cofactor prefoldin
MNITNTPPREFDPLYKAVAALVDKHFKELNETLNTRFDAIEERIDRLEKRVEPIEKRMDRLERKFDYLSGDVIEFKERVRDIEDSLAPKN